VKYLYSKYNCSWDQVFPRPNYRKGNRFELFAQEGNKKTSLGLLPPITDVQAIGQETVVFRRCVR